MTTASFTVNAVNDAPVAQEGTFATDEDTPLSDGVTVTDTDNPKLLSPDP